jgi:hypothetical protein
LPVHAGIGEHGRREDADSTPQRRDARLGGHQSELLESQVMIQITPQMRVLAAVEPVDFRRGIDGLARLCKEAITQYPPQ